MPKTVKLTTVVSTKGQIVLPATIRKQHHWDPGTRLIVEETDEGVLLKEQPLFESSMISDVFGMLKYTDEPKTLEEMDAAIAAQARLRHAGS
ncbi:AbrB/MazE/SpoVT family DNA-binding domain-containing protein [Phyllobacterium bourgognense]|uniref:AbrB family transcriptional regulator n=1 Tax=Phyllobacterium bourgognense TaxID=314236 RepID=A0A368YK37_9HYPH|nr:AbrB/MazE/SpoVT family DNA-binding domain-containing protein [Phyllobacterium bourgognense]RCW80602.1 AbrB family transcriptional regulator [Phyllobacterium bourgognense]